jgi:flagellar biosynthetic protein FliS
MADGGEIAATLRRLYDYFDRLLQESNVTKTVDGIDEVTRRVTTLRDSWREMLQKRGAERADGSNLAPPDSARCP